MPKGPCMCGDPECPSCGAAMGTYNRDRPEPDYDAKRCDACGTLLEMDQDFLCPECDLFLKQTNPSWKPQ